MLKVYLPRTWFVRGRRIKRSRTDTDLRNVPDEWRDKLPKGARVVDDTTPVVKPDRAFADEPPEPAKADLHALDHDRAAGEAAEKIRKQADDAAEAQRKANAEKFQAELAADTRQPKRK
jgi:hypothetical protein